MSTTRFTLPSVVFLILEHDGRILLMRRANTGWHDGDFDLPAGHIEGGEASSVAAAREGLEELGATIDPQDLSFVLLTHGVFSDGKEYYNLFFRATKWQGNPRIMEPDKCDRLEWFSNDPTKWPDNVTPSLRLAIQAMRDKLTYMEHGFMGLSHSPQ